MQHQRRRGSTDRGGIQVYVGSRSSCIAECGSDMGWTMYPPPGTSRMTLTTESTLSRNVKIWDYLPNGTESSDWLPLPLLSTALRPSPPLSGLLRSAIRERGGSTGEEEDRQKRSIVVVFMTREEEKKRRSCLVSFARALYKKLAPRASPCCDEYPPHEPPFPRSDGQELWGRKCLFSTAARTSPGDKQRQTQGVAFWLHCICKEPRSREGERRRAAAN